MSSSKFEAKAPLLEPQNSIRSEDASADQVIEEVADDHHQTLSTQVLDESSKLWKIVGPTIVFRLASYSMVVVTQAFAGHIGDLELASVSIGYNFIMGLDFALLLGMASALERYVGKLLEPGSTIC